MRAPLLAPLLLALVLSACASTGDITYIATAPLTPGPPNAVSAVTTQDIRGEKPTRLATVRSIYGSPAQVFDTTRPVADEVSEVFTAALKARGMLAPTAPYRITIMLRKYYGDTYIARRAFIDVQFYVVNQAGQPVYKDTYTNDIGGYDVFSGITDLVPFTQKILAIAVDTLLDKPELRRLLNNPVPPPPLPVT